MMKRIRWWAAAAVSALLLATTAVAAPQPAPGPAPAAPTPAEPAEPANPADKPERPCVPAGPDERFLVDFEAATLRDVTRLVACAAELNVLFLPSSLASKQVTVISSRPIGLRDLVQLWHELLANHGLVAERRGAYLAVKPAG